MSLGTLYKRALEVAFGGTANVFNYADRDDFKRLWSTKSNAPAILTDWSPKQGALVIVWDGPGPLWPISEQSAADSQLLAHLTPLDWALAFSCRLLESEELRARAVFGIFIVDLAGQQDSGAWAMRMRHQLLADLPWVSVCAPLPCLINAGQRYPFCLPVVQPAEQSFGQSSVDMAISELQPAALLARNPEGAWRVPDGVGARTLERSADASSPLRLRGLVGQWAASLTQSDEHHDINNIVGPMVLARAFGVQTKLASPTIRAFLTRLEWCGQLPSFAPESLEQLGGVQDSTQAGPTKAILEGHRKLCGRDPLGGLRSNQVPQIRYYLLDDQAGAGYADALANILSATTSRSGDSPSKPARPHSLRWSESPDELLGWLRACSPKGRMGHLGEIDVLFLDLRLWMGGIGSERAKDVIKKVVGLVGDLKLLDESVDSHLQEAFAAASLCAAGGKPTYSEELAAVTLLPLLVSHCDPSLPVIVFSSTRQREVTHRLQHRPSIRCHFTKPFLLSNENTLQPGSVAGDRSASVPPLLQAAVDQLTTAILGALAQLRLRPIWRRILALQLNPPKYPSNDGSTGGYKQGLVVTKSVWPRGVWTQQVNWMTAEFKLSSAETKRRMQHLFFHLARGEIGALLSGCFELIEAGYSTTRQKRESDKLELLLTYNKAVGNDPHEAQSYRFTMLAVSLKEIRHFKAHALDRHTDPDHSEGNAIQFAGGAMMLALLDFLERRSDCIFSISPENAGSSVLVRGYPPWHIKERAGRRTSSDAAFVMSVLIAALDAAVHGCKDFTVPRNSPERFFSKELMALCNSIIQDESLLDIN